MLPTANPNGVSRETVTCYRREGYTEEISLEVAGQAVSFAPGQYATHLELYVATDKKGERAIRVVSHQVGADPTVARLVFSSADLATLSSDTYNLRIFLTCPDGAVYVVVDGQLCLS